MSDSGRQIGDCEHAKPRQFCPICLREEIVSLRIDSENYRGCCDTCGTANKDMLTDTYCAVCEVKRLTAENERLRQALKPLTLLNPDEEICPIFPD